MSLPSGTVTLLFTDVEDSTGLLRELDTEYGLVLEEHRRLVREEIGRHGGHEVDVKGDEFFLAFERPQAAVEAAVGVQRALAEHEWPSGGRVRVRMGLHTGSPTPRSYGYVGLDVHRAARICSVGHGGQVLLSQTTLAHLGDAVAAEDLGEYQLRGLPDPERIFQLAAPGLETRFPPLRLVQASDRSAKVVGMRVVLADDSVLLREGIARLLEDAGFEVVAQSGTADDLLRHVPMHKPDVAIVDIRMPPTQTDEGLRAAKQIRERWPETGVLVLSQYVEAAYAIELLGDSAEGVGYLLKDRVSDIEEFAAAVRRVGEGGSALDPAVVSQLVGRRRAQDPLEELTPREREVLEYMAEGKSNQAIAERMVITLRAVEKHVTSIFSKLHLPASEQDHRRVLAVLAFLRS